MNTLKVGDWVSTAKYGIGIIEHIADTNSPYQVKHFPGRDVYEAEELTPWRPKEGEWCWFWVSSMKYPDLRRFKQYYMLLSQEPDYMAEDSKYLYTRCEPYIGTLPTKLQEL